MNSEIIRQVLTAGDKRREQRRSFLRVAGATTAAVAGSAFLASCDDDKDTPTPTPTPTATMAAINDSDILNFALNLEYLEAEFYLYATTGSGLAANQRSGTVGTQGAVNASGVTAVPFTDPVVRQYAREIAADEAAHVAFLRGALGPSAVAEPAIDIGVGANNAFSNAARAAGLIGAGQTFNPYASDEAFLIGAFIFEDVGVTAYKGASPLLTKTYIEAAAGILAAEAYHAGLVRTVLYRKGIQTPATMIGNQDLIGATEAISALRDGADNGTDTDQGIRPSSVNGQLVSNLVPVDPTTGIVYSRSPGDVLNIVYLTKEAVRTSPGSFFPNGVNGVNTLFTTSSAFA